MSALNSAVKRKLVAFNAASHVEIDSGRRPKAVVWTEEAAKQWTRSGVRPAVAVWTPEQAGAFLDAIDGDRLYALYLLVALRGLRRGEAVGLPWSAVDLDSGQLRVGQQIVQLGYATEMTTPKSDKGTRVVALDTDTPSALKSHRAAQNAERLAWGTGWTDSGLVFTREDGTPLHPEYVTRHFERLSAKAGLPPIRLHDLRHTAATLALAAGVDLKVISEQLGHSSITITADTYASVLPQLARDAADRTAAIVPRARDGLQLRG